MRKQLKTLKYEYEHICINKKNIKNVLHVEKEVEEFA